MKDNEESTSKEKPTPANIPYLEALVEANVQQSLDSLDAWKLMAPLGDALPEEKRSACTQKKHTCDMNAENPSLICYKCRLYRQLVLDRSFYPGIGRQLCDFIAINIAHPIITEFVTHDAWLTPLAQLTGHWFVRAPITYVLRQPTSVLPIIQCHIRRNKVHIYEADALIERLGLTKCRETIYSHLREAIFKSEKLTIYLLDEFLDSLGPLTQLAHHANGIGINIGEVDSEKTAIVIQSVLNEMMH